MWFYLISLLIHEFGCFCDDSNLTEKDGSEDRSQFSRALSARSPLLSGCAICDAFIISGDSRNSGFIGKLNIITGALRSGAAILCARVCHDCEQP